MHNLVDISLLLLNVEAYKIRLKHATPSISVGHISKVMQSQNTLIF
jgi:hypothetical protein